MTPFIHFIYILMSYFLFGCFGFFQKRSKIKPKVAKSASAKHFSFPKPTILPKKNTRLLLNDVKSIPSHQPPIDLNKNLLPPTADPQPTLLLAPAAPTGHKHLGNMTDREKAVAVLMGLMMKNGLLCSDGTLDSYQIFYGRNNDHLLQTFLDDMIENRSITWDKVLMLAEVEDAISPTQLKSLGINIHKKDKDGNTFQKEMQKRGSVLNLNGIPPSSHHSDQLLNPKHHTDYRKRSQPKLQCG